jgi:hypothetical protein
MQQILDDEIVDVGNLVPHYIRRSDAEIKREEEGLLTNDSKKI